MITFIADFPEGDQIKDGMYQRIVAIDSEFKDQSKIYLSISYLHNFKSSIIENGQRTIYKLNYFKHFFKIRKILKNSGTIYIHSIANGIRILFQFKKKNNKVILDAHGVVPEECIFRGLKLKGKIYDYVEKRLMSRIDYVVVVSNNMQKHFINKYYSLKDIVYLKKTIYPENLFNNNTIVEPESNNNKVEILYSGNLQKWQNVDLMVETIRKMDNPQYKFTILTQNREEMINLLGDLYTNRDIEVKSVFPDELAYFYSKAHYGFILRDDVLLNRVSAPTKMMEYLTYGVRPIILSPNIGDWVETGYEYISIDDKIINHLPMSKSIKNKKIAAKILLESNKNLSEFFYRK